MNGGVAQSVGNLGEIHVLFPNHFFGPYDFHMRKIFNDTAAAFTAEQLLKLGSANQIIPADFIQRKVLRETGFHVSMNAAERLIVLF